MCNVRVNGVWAKHTSMHKVYKLCGYGLFNIYLDCLQAFQWTSCFIASFKANEIAREMKNHVLSVGLSCLFILN